MWEMGPYGQKLQGKRKRVEGRKED